MSKKLAIFTLASAGAVFALSAAGAAAAAKWQELPPMGKQLYRYRRTIGKTTYYWTELASGEHDLAAFYHPEPAKPQMVQHAWMSAWPDGRLKSMGGEKQVLEIMRRDGGKLDVPRLGPKATDERRFEIGANVYLVRTFGDEGSSVYLMTPTKSGQVRFWSNGIVRQRLADKPELDQMIRDMQTHSDLFAGLRVPQSYEELPPQAGVPIS